MRRRHHQQSVSISRLRAGMAVAMMIGIASAMGTALVSATGQTPANSRNGSAAPATAAIALWRSLLVRPAPPAGPDDAAAVIRRARVALGAELFTDPRLSGPGNRSCASCHKPGLGFTDGRARAERIDGGLLARNTPTLWNIGFASRLNWDGRETQLEQHARRPIEHPLELAGSLEHTAGRLAGDKVMRARFAVAFPDAPTPQPSSILSALAVYQRSLVSPPTRFDRWAMGDDDALSNTELAGFSLFVGKGRCATCHAGWRFTDDRLHDIGRPHPAQGEHLTLVKTPTLRELVSTAPYMHDGSLRSLDDVVRHYSSGVVRRGTLSPNLPVVLALSEPERASLVAFLKTLSSARPRQ